MVKGIKVLIGDNDVAERTRIREVLNREADIQVVEMVGDGVECQNRALALHPDVVILRSDLPNKKGLEIAEQLYMDRPDIGLILLLSGSENEDIWRQMVLAGINEYVTRPIDPQRLINGIRKVVGIKRKFSAQSNGSREGARKVITVASARGGCGKTFLASNLAVIFSRQSAKTVLADFTLTGGDAGMFLDVIPQRTLKDLFAVYGGVDADVLESMVTRHSSGLAVLSSPLNSFEPLKVSKNAVERVCGLLHQEYEICVVDTDSPSTEITQVAINHSDFVVVVSGADLPRLKSTKFFIRDLTGRIPEEKVKVVLNRYSAAKDISNAEAQSVLEFPVLATLPHDSALVSSSINHGQPLALSQPGKSISETIQQVASALYTPAAATAAAPGVRTGLRRFFHIVP